MKKLDILILFIVCFISVVLFGLLQGKLSNGYTLFIIVTIGFVTGFMVRLFTKSENEKKS